MEDYNFWRDFFDTYQSLSDGMKFAWLVVPPTFLLGLVALSLRYRLAARRATAPETGHRAYIVFSMRMAVFRSMPITGRKWDQSMAPKREIGLWCRLSIGILERKSV